MTISPPPVEAPPRKSPSYAAAALGVVLVAFIISLCFNSQPAADLFWQIRTGSDIAASHHAPHADAYSWSRTGHPWIAHEWLCFLLIWEAYKLGGFGAIWIGETLIVALIGWLVYQQTLRVTKAPITAFLFTALSGVLASDFFQPRPHLFTYLFFTVTMIVMQNVHSGVWERKYLWSLIPVFLLWSNLHAGSIIGVIALGAFTVGDLVDSRRFLAEDHRLRERAKTTALLTLACALCTIVTPYGPRVYENIWSTITNATAMDTVMEWASPNFHETNGKTLELFFGVVICALAFTRRKLETGAMLILGFLAVESLSAIRNMPLFALACAALVSEDLQNSIERFTATAKETSEYMFGPTPSGAIVPAVAISFVLLSAAHVSSLFREDHRTGMSVLPRIAGDSFRYDYFPARACRFIENEQFPRSMKMYNIYDFGGYLIWRLPQYPVVIDGRADIYFGSVLEQTNKVQKLSYRWQEVLDQYHCDFVFTSAAKKQSHLYLNSPDWVLVYADRGDLDDDNGLVNAMIFVRNRPEFQPLIARCRAHCPAAVVASPAIPEAR